MNQTAKSGRYIPTQYYRTSTTIPPTHDLSHTNHHTSLRWTLFTDKLNQELASGTGPSITTDPLLTRTVEVTVDDPTTTDASIRFNCGDVEWLDSEGPDPNDPNRPSYDQNGRNTWKRWRNGFERDFDCVFIDNEAPKNDAPADAPANPPPSTPDNAPPNVPAPAGPCRSDSDCGGTSCEGEARSVRLRGWDRVQAYVNVKSFRRKRCKSRECCCVSLR